MPSKSSTILDVQTFFELVRLPIRRTEPESWNVSHDRLVDKLDGGYASVAWVLSYLPGAWRTSDRCREKLRRVVAYAGTSKIETRFDHSGRTDMRSASRRCFNSSWRNYTERDHRGRAPKGDEAGAEIAIREILANASSIRDFTVGGASVMIEVYQ